jgi:hypothetical protein
VVRDVGEHAADAETDAVVDDDVLDGDGLRFDGRDTVGQQAGALERRGVDREA